MKHELKDFPDELRGMGRLGSFEHKGKVWRVMSCVYAEIDHINNIIYTPGSCDFYDGKEFVPKDMIPKLKAVIKDYVKSFVRLKGLPAPTWYVAVKHIPTETLEEMYNVLMGKQYRVTIPGYGLMYINEKKVSFGQWDITVDEAWDNLEIILDKKIELEQEFV